MAKKRMRPAPRPNNAVEEILTALEQLVTFVRTAVPLDALSDEKQDECWHLDKIGRQAIEKIRKLRDATR